MPSRGAVTHTDSLTSRAAPRRLGILMAVYLLGIFMGALETGIVTPARTIIQSDLGADDASGIWMLTIYTLAYAASIPVMGKLADRRGRKPIYLLSIALFGLGEEDELGPALRLVGLVGFLIALTGMLDLRLYIGDYAQAGGWIGRLVGHAIG